VEAAVTLRATLDLVQAGEEVWDVAVVGAGPAGAMAARELAKLGAQVLLVDKASFPRQKVCGCCLNRCSLSTLRSVGLEDLTERLGAVSVDRFDLAVSSRHARLRLPARTSVSREAFDAALVAAAIESGAAFLPETRARLGSSNADSRQLVLSQKAQACTISASVLVAADGLAGQLLGKDSSISVRIRPKSRIGAGVVTRTDDDAYEPGRIYMACDSGGYVGLVRLEDGRLDIASALDPALVKRSGGLGPAVEQIIAEAGFPPLRDLADADWRGTPLLTRRVVPPACHRAFAIGDAAGYAEPFTGEGIAWALAAGASVAPLAHQAASRWQPSLIDEWSRECRRLFRRKQWICLAIAKALRHKTLTRAVVTALSRAPMLATPIVRLLDRPARRR